MHITYSHIHAWYYFEPLCSFDNYSAPHCIRLIRRFINRTTYVYTRIIALCRHLLPICANQTVCDVVICCWNNYIVMLYTERSSQISLLYIMEDCVCVSTYRQFPCAMYQIKIHSRHAVSPRGEVFDDVTDADQAPKGHHTSQIPSNTKDIKWNPQTKYQQRIWIFLNSSKIPQFSQTFARSTSLLIRSSTALL